MASLRVSMTALFKAKRLLAWLLRAALHIGQRLKLTRYSAEQVDFLR